MPLQTTDAASDTALPIVLKPVGALARRIRETPPRYALGVLALTGSYLVAMRLGVGAVRTEQLLVSAPFLLAFWSNATRRFLLAMLPFLLFGVVYDLTHITQPLFRYLTIHIAEPYAFDQRFFGIPSGEGVLTPNEFFARHHWPVVDFFTGLSYIVFVYWPIGFAACVSIFCRDERSRRLVARFGWVFLVMNVVGFATYYAYPAAPPWYVADYGFGPVHMEARSSPAFAARWDELTGIPYFAAFYGRSADVFGAIPSLHPTYPLLTYLYGRELGKRWLNAASFGLFALVAFAAIYLNHHYVLDVLIGLVYTLVPWGIDRALERRREKRAASPA